MSRRLGNAFNVTNGQTLNMRSQRDGGRKRHVPPNGSTVTGGGTFTGNVLALSGSTIRVGMRWGRRRQPVRDRQFRKLRVGRRPHHRQPAVDCSPGHDRSPTLKALAARKVLTYGWAGGISRCVARSARGSRDRKRSDRHVLLSRSIRRRTIRTTTLDSATRPAPARATSPISRPSCE